MLSSEEFKKFTGVAREATLEEMVIQLTKKVVQENNGLIGQALLSHELINTYGWKVSQGAHVTGLTPNQVRSAANRGAILTQCVAAHVPSVYASLRACSSERTITLNKECLAIMDSQRIGEFVVNAVRCEIVAGMVQGKPEDHAAINEALKEKGITAPAAIRNAVPTIAKALEVKLPERKRESGSGPKMSETAPTMKRVSEALTAWTEDRITGSEGEAFEMRDDEATAAVAVIGNMVRQLLKAGRVDEVAAVLADIDEAIADHAARSEAEPLADVSARMNRNTFAEA